MKIQDILKSLEKKKVKYAVIGGLAVVLYGYVRFTKDIDLIIDFSRENVKKFVQAISALHFQPGVPIEPLDLANPKKREEWMKEKNAKVITFYNPNSQLLQIDVLLTKSLSEVKSTKRRIDDFEISIVDYDDLIDMKRKTARPTDLLDVEKLEELKRT